LYKAFHLAESGRVTTTWAPYGFGKLGVTTRHTSLTSPFGVYGGGGVVLLLPTRKVSSNAVQLGGYGLAGIELFLDDKRTSSMQLELGGMGTGARADKLVGAPIYANGFTISWGFNYHL
jgi:hypothetical protein